MIPEIHQIMSQRHKVKSPNYCLSPFWQNINGVPKIQENYNPATWMLEITSSSSEEQLDLNFAHIYENSHLCR